MAAGQRSAKGKGKGPCRDDYECTRPNCVFEHPNGRRNGEAITSVNNGEDQGKWAPCRNGRDCVNKGCKFEHPNGRQIDAQKSEGQDVRKSEGAKKWGPCRDKYDCVNKGCKFDHPNGRRIDAKKSEGQQKWAPCRDDYDCKNKGCKFEHPNGRRIDGEDHGASDSKGKRIVPCRKGNDCANIGCKFDHPHGRKIDDEDGGASTSTGERVRSCRNGEDCTRRGCYFDHPNGRRIDKEGTDDSAPVNIFVGGLPKKCTEHDVSKFFEEFGAIKKIDLKFDQEKGTFRGFGFVTFASAESAAEVLACPKLNFEGKMIECKAAQVPRFADALDELADLDDKALPTFAEKPPPGVLKACSEYVLDECNNAMPAMGEIQEAVKEVSRLTKLKLESAENKHLLSTFNVIESMLFAIIMYTFDLCLIFPAAMREKNFYFCLNCMLRTRDVKSMKQCAGYLYYLMTGLTRLPPYTSPSGFLYRGISSSGAERAKKEYHQGRSCLWSGFSSASPSIVAPKEFANMEGPGGVILRIRILDDESRARDIRPFSAFPMEDEILLLPNFKTLVIQKAKFNAELGVDVIDLFEQAEADVDVF